MRTEKIVASALALLAVNTLREQFSFTADLDGVHTWHVSTSEPDFTHRFTMTGCYTNGNCVTVRIDSLDDDPSDELFIATVVIDILDESPAKVFRFVYKELYPESLLGWVELKGVAEIPYPEELGELWLTTDNFVQA